jgi:serine/threonine-protein kinase
MEKICPTCRRSYASADMFCPEDGSALAAKSDATTSAPPTDRANIADPNDPLIGRVLDSRYQLTNLLGMGGMGRVYLAQHLFLERPVAVKILHRSRVSDESELVRFRGTAKHAGTIVDDHVAQVYDFGETDDGLLYLAMEYVPGDTVTRMVKKEGPFEPSRVAELTRQIAKGLDAAHAQGIIHRDLKPDNIMVMRDRHGREMVKIVDFGIAKSLGNEGGGVTQTGAIVGTLVFMSPEQLAGGALDRRSDLYSLALVVFHMLTGALPFTGSTPEEVIYARFDTSGPRPLAVIRPAVSWPAGVQAVIDRALARDATSRYDTAGEFATALSAATAQHAPPAVVNRPRPNVTRRGPTMGQRAAAWFQQHGRQTARVVAVGIVAVFVIAAGARVVTPWIGSRRTAAVDSLSRRTAAGEARVGQDTGSRIPRTLTKAAIRPNDPIKSNVRPESSTRSTVGASADDRKKALSELERLRDHLHPDSAVTRAYARDALTRLDALMPRLHNRTDSLFAMLYQSHAYYHLNDLDQQCAVLRRMRARAGGTRLEELVEGYFGPGKCTDY